MLAVARRALLDAQEALESRRAAVIVAGRLSPLTGLTGLDHHATLAI